MKEYSGTLGWFFETGTEGLVWILTTKRSRWQRLMERLRRVAVSLPSAVIVAARQTSDAGNGRKAGFLTRVRCLVQEKCALLSYNDIVVIEEGDCLAIFGPGSTVIFDGEIVCDYRTGWQSYPDGLGGQPCALGYRIRWTQQGWQPDDWARLFLRVVLERDQGGGDPFRAVLVRRN